MADTPTKVAMCDALAQYFDSADLADFTVICGLKSWKAHRLALSLHSKVFAKACNGEFKEAKEHKIDLSDHEPNHVNAFISYIYKLDYEATGADDKPGPSMVFHTQMCFIGDKYDMIGLKKLSIAKFQKAIKQATKGDDLAHVASLAYSGAAAVEVICRSIVSHIVENDFLSESAEEESKKLQVSMELHPQLAIDALKASIRSGKPVENVKEPPPVPVPVPAATPTPTPDLNYRCPGCARARRITSAVMDSPARTIMCLSCRGIFAAHRWSLGRV